MIEKTLIPENKRIGFLASQLGSMHFKFEMLTYIAKDTWAVTGTSIISVTAGSLWA